MSDRCYRCGGQSTTSHVCPPLHAGQSAGSYPDHRDSEILALKAENEALRKQRDDEAWYHAALKQEVESLKVCVGQRNDSLSDLQKSFGEVCEELKRYTSWQPSDPGTKEAMDALRDMWPGIDELQEVPGQLTACDAMRRLIVSHRAAMVRLEEAEKRDEFHVSQCAALTASLASVSKERNEYYSWWQAQKQTIKSHAESHDEVLAELAELRKRMGESEKLLESAHRGCGDFDTEPLDENGGDQRERGETIRQFLASPPSPAPVESKPKEGI